MVRTRVAICVALLWLGVSSANAQGVLADGWYVGVEAGQSKLDRHDFIGVVSQDDSSEAWSVLAGYRCSRYFSLEGGYTDLGDFEDEAKSE